VLGNKEFTAVMNGMVKLIVWYKQNTTNSPFDEVKINRCDMNQSMLKSNLVNRKGPLQQWYRIRIIYHIELQRDATLLICFNLYIWKKALRRGWRNTRKCRKNDQVSDKLYGSELTSRWSIHHWYHNMREKKWKNENIIIE
jgi:hypothetical protein